MTGADRVLSFAAAPVFAIMAILTGIPLWGMPAMVCSTTHDPSPFNGMVLMYLLMGTFHLGPWLRLITLRRDCARVGRGERSRLLLR
jgi:hypothetical protein